MAEDAEQNAVDVLYKDRSKEVQALITASFKPVAASGEGPVAAMFNVVLG